MMIQTIRDARLRNLDVENLRVKLVSHFTPVGRVIVIERMISVRHVWTMFTERASQSELESDGIPRTILSLATMAIRLPTPESGIIGQEQ
jgi:hypothetical protein